MKYLFTLLLFAAPFFLQAQTPADPLLLKETQFDFGKIPQGKPVFHLFEFTNAGSDSLQIRDIQASCGCTTPEWDRNALAPGARSVIKVGYNAAAEGPFTKSVTINVNGQQKIIVISGSVFKAPPTSAPLNSSISLLKNTNH